MRLGLPPTLPAREGRPPHTVPAHRSRHGGRAAEARRGECRLRRNPSPNHQTHHGQARVRPRLIRRNRRGPGPGVVSRVGEGSGGPESGPGACREIRDRLLCTYLPRVSRHRRLRRSHNQPQGLGDPPPSQDRWLPEGGLSTATGTRPQSGGLPGGAPGPRIDRAPQAIGSVREPSGEGLRLPFEKPRRED